MHDKIEYVMNCCVQHGKSSDRVYLMKLDSVPVADLLPALDQLARTHSYGKIFAKAPEPFRQDFERAGYRVEARVPRFYPGKTAGVFMGKYFSAERAAEQRADRVKDVLAACAEKEVVHDLPALRNGCVLSRMAPEDAEEMVEVYKEVFQTYPFPIHEPSYLRKSMNENIVYFGVRESGRLVALSSSEMDESSSNVEMTDFATRLDCRGQGFALHLLRAMEAAMRERGLTMAYTIARAYSFGMNITFAKAGYTFAGTLTSNTDISGALESMNVWYKPLGS